MLALGYCSAQAQTGVPAVAGAPSAPRPAKPPSRLMSPTATRDSATQPGELRPERPVVPQINIPLGATAHRPAARTAQRDPPASTGAVHDATARCKALESESERAKCLTRMAREPR